MIYRCTVHLREPQLIGYKQYPTSNLKSLPKLRKFYPLNICLDKGMIYRCTVLLREPQLIGYKQYPNSNLKSLPKHRKFYPLRFCLRFHFIIVVLFGFVNNNSLNYYLVIKTLYQCSQSLRD